MIKRCGKCYQTLTYEQAWFDEVHICTESVPQKNYIEQKELLMEEGKRYKEVAMMAALERVKASSGCDKESIMQGKKYDGGKPRMELLPPNAIIEVAKVLAFGAEKYAPENWRKLEDLQNRYTGASLRHVFAHMDKERLDKETHLSHLAHAICCLLFKLEIELEETREEERLRRLERSKRGESDQTPEPYYESSKGWVTGDILLSATQTDNEERSVPTFKDCLQYPTSSQNNRGTQ